MLGLFSKNRIVCLFVVVVRGFDESGAESEESFVETSYEDPLSHREYPFTGDFLFRLCERKESNKFCLVDAKKGILSLFLEFAMFFRLNKKPMKFTRR